MNQDRILKRFIVVSLAVHLGALVISMLNWQRRIPQVDMIEISFEDSFDLGGKEEAIKDAAIAEEAAVPERSLPQAPKRLEIEDGEVTDEIALDEGEKKKAKEKPRISKEELVRRKKMDELIRQKKFADQLQAQKSEALKSLKSLLAENKGLGSGSDDMIKSLRQQVEKCRKLPSFFQGRTDLQISFKVKFDDQGHFSSKEVLEPSPEEYYDQLTEMALDECAPYRGIPERYVEKEIVLKIGTTG